QASSRCWTSSQSPLVCCHRGLMELKGRVSVITGGASGIGAAGARAVSAVGATVVVAGRNADGAGAGAAGVAGGAPVGGVADAAAVDTMVARVRERHGRLDVLWANAGIAGVRAPCAEQPTDAWENVLRVNLTGVSTRFVPRCGRWCPRGEVCCWRRRRWPGWR